MKIISNGWPWSVLKVLRWKHSWSQQSDFFVSTTVLKVAELALWKTIWTWQIPNVYTGTLGTIPITCILIWCTSMWIPFAQIIPSVYKVTKLWRFKGTLKANDNYSTIYWVVAKQFQGLHHWLRPSNYEPLPLLYTHLLYARWIKDWFFLPSAQRANSQC